jgi:hypothetical protein
MAAATTVAIISLAECGSSGPALSVDAVHTSADKLVASPNGACPLGLDVPAAMKDAGVAAAVTPASPAASGDTDKSVGADSPLVKTGGAMIECDYEAASGAGLKVVLLAVRTGQARSLLAPLIAHDSKLSHAELEAMFGDKFVTGTTVLSPSGGTSALARLKVSGGDAVLLVDSPDGGTIAGEPLRKAAEKFVSQLKL